MTADPTYVDEVNRTLLLGGDLLFLSELITDGEC